MKTRAIAFTAGIDSTVLSYQLKREQNKEEDLYLLACDYGQANWKMTVELGNYHARDLPAIFVPIKVTLPEWEYENPTGLFKSGYKPGKANGPVFDYADGKMSYEDELVPYRNAFLFLYMLSWCQREGIDTLFTGHQYEDSEWENVESYRHRTEDFGIYFLDRINSLAELGSKKYIRTRAPFLETKMDKKKICKMGLRFGIDLKNETYSCQYMPICNLCDNCVNRNRIFAEIGIS